MELIDRANREMAERELKAQENQPPPDVQDVEPNP